MKTKTLTPLFLLFLLVLTGWAGAQTPDKINYQAVVRDAQGDILDQQAVKFEISVLQGSATGTAVYTETHSLTTNDLGLANFQIGAGTPVSGSFSTINWGSNAYFVEVGLDATGGSNFTLMGTQELVSVPYALRARSVDNDQVDDADADPINEIQDISLSGTALSISSGSTVDLSVLQDGVNDADADPANELQTLSLTGSDVTLSNGGGTVSINDADADASNELQTISLTGSDVTLSNGGGTLSINDADADASNELQTISLSGDDLTLSNSGGTVDLSGYADSQWSASGNDISNINSGNVGIGTATPAEKLEVNGAVKVEQKTLNPSPNTVYGNTGPIAYGDMGGPGPNVALNTGYGVASVTKTGVGTYEITLQNGFSGQPIVLLTSWDTQRALLGSYYPFGGNKVSVKFRNLTTGAAEDCYFSFVMFGYTQ